jgi:hypothetical protein
MSTDVVLQLLTKLSTGDTPFFEDLITQIDKIRSVSNRLAAGNVTIDTTFTPCTVSKPIHKKDFIQIVNEICEFSIDVANPTLADEGNLLYTRRYGGIAIVAGKDEKYLGKLSNEEVPIFDRYIHNRIKNYKMHVVEKSEYFVKLRLVPTEFH